MWYTEIIIAVIGIVSVVVTHALDKKRHRAEIAKLSTEIQGDSIGNMDKSLDFYEKWVEKTNHRLDEVLRNQDRLIQENATLKEELNTVKEQTTRMSSLLCTNLPCTQRVQDASVIDCIYYAPNTKKARRNGSKKKNSEEEN